MLMRVIIKAVLLFMVAFGTAVALAGQQQAVTMEVTAYCDCGECNGYKRGSWKFLKLDKWNRYDSSGNRYTGKTASGGELKEPRAGLLSGETIQKPWTVPGKVVMPWRAKQRLGTIAADTTYYPFGTRMYVPGWGWGIVGDRGSAIKGPPADRHLLQPPWRDNPVGQADYGCYCGICCTGPVLINLCNQPSPAFMKPFNKVCLSATTLVPRFTCAATARSLLILP